MVREIANILQMRILFFHFQKQIYLFILPNIHWLYLVYFFLQLVVMFVVCCLSIRKKPEAKAKRIPQLSHNLLRQIESIQGFLKMDSYLFTSVGYFHIIKTL
jgi:hypothetical protein